MPYEYIGTVNHVVVPFPDRATLAIETLEGRPEVLAHLKPHVYPAARVRLERPDGSVLEKVVLDIHNYLLQQGNHVLSPGDGLGLRLLDNWDEIPVGTKVYLHLETSSSEQGDAP